MENDNGNNRAIAEMYERISIPPNSRHIRLLNVYACQPNEAANAPIRCDLVVANLETPPHFTALSYVWGSGSSTILCGDVPVNVTSNCFSALQHLRATNGHLLIWIDAVCINQRDLTEKQHQIDMMADIYSKAFTTYAWIGEGDESTARVVNYLSRAGFVEHFLVDGDVYRGERLEKPRQKSAVLDYAKGLLGIGPNTLPSDLLSYEPFFSKKHTLSEDSECTVQELDLFFKCKWTTRIWTYQELVLSRNAVIVRGASQIPWPRLEYSIVFLSRLYMDEDMLRWMEMIKTRRFLLDKTENTSKYVSDLQKYARFCSPENIHNDYELSVYFLNTFTIGVCLVQMFIAIGFVQEAVRFRIPLIIYAVACVAFAIFIGCIDILKVFHFKSAISARLQKSCYHGYDRTQDSICESILNTLQTRTATDARDMSFGLLSILDRLLGIEALPAVDYNLSTQEVFRQLTEYLMIHDGLVIVLELAAQKRCIGTPSWIPDYSHVYSRISDRKEEFLAERKLVETDPAFTLIYEDIRPPVRNLNTQYHFHPRDSTRLLLPGVMLGSIIDTQNDPQCNSSAIFESEYSALLEMDTMITCSNGLLGISYNSVRTGDCIILVPNVSFHIIVRGDSRGYKIIAPALPSNRTKYPTAQGVEDGGVVQRMWENYRWLKADSTDLSEKIWIC